MKQTVCLILLWVWLKRHIAGVVKCSISECHFNNVDLTYDLQITQTACQMLRSRDWLLALSASLIQNTSLVEKNPPCEITYLLVLLTNKTKCLRTFGFGSLMSKLSENICHLYVWHSFNFLHMCQWTSHPAHNSFGLCDLYWKNGNKSEVSFKLFIIV